MINKGYKKLENFTSSRNINIIKDDQGDTRNPYKCMNVMKQDIMDDKIKEICKTCENNACKRILTDQEAVEDLSSRQKVSRWIEKLSRFYQEEIQKS